MKASKEIGSNNVKNVKENLTSNSLLFDAIISRFFNYINKISNNLKYEIY